MSETTPQEKPVQPPKRRPSGLVNTHFLIAALILGGVAVGWNVLVATIKVYTMKLAVPWPADVMVNEEFRMLSLPEKFGPYEFVSADGELYPKDGKPDGQIDIDEETMGLLKIGTPTDRGNLPKRKSNWQVVCYYRDTRVEPGQRHAYWRGEIYYYTGGVDLVPHVPEICGVAGGAVLLGSEDISVSLPGAPSQWGAGPVAFRRARFELAGLGGDAKQFVQYYTFSLNGLPESDRNAVRLKLTSPFVRYAYFAKIQFAPWRTVADQAQTDEAAREFARHFLPAALKVLPMPEDIEKLSAGGEE